MNVPAPAASAPDGESSGPCLEEELQLVPRNGRLPGTTPIACETLLALAKDFDLTP